MNILILGYGKMGHAVEQEALDRGHSIVGGIDKANLDKLDRYTKTDVDVVIEFTHPDSFRGNLRRILDIGIPMVSGTTGWHHQLEEVQQEVEAANGSFLYASNFSVGVNLMFAMNKKLAQLMNAHPDYDVFVEEQHHRYKADAPSGTAISLAQELLQHLDRKTSVSTEELRSRAPQEEELSVGYIRAGEIIGQHSVTYRSDIDRLTLTHEAYNRRGFALGAVIAAEWLAGEKACIRSGNYLNNLSPFTSYVYRDNDV